MLEKPTWFRKLMREFDRARFHSSIRGKLLREYAKKGGISVRTAHRRLVFMRDQLDAEGRLLTKRSRKDRGKPRGAEYYDNAAVERVRKALKNKKRTLRSIATEYGVSYHLVRLIDRGQI